MCTPCGKQRAGLNCLHVKAAPPRYGFCPSLLMVAQTTLHESPTKVRWIVRCAMRLRERRPDLSRDEVIDQADSLWESEGFRQSPEETADLVIGHRGPVSN